MADDSSPQRGGPLWESDPELASAVEIRLSLPIRGSDDLIELMARVAAIAVQHIAGADHAGITAAFDDIAPFTVAPTDERVSSFDRAQYEFDGGPCLLAARTDRIVHFDLAEMGQLWPDLSITAHQSSIRRVTAAPLHHRAISIGSLNLYTDHSTAATILTTSDLLPVLLGHLDRGLDEFGLHLTSTALAHELLQGVETRALIDNAIGVIMGLRHCSDIQAADLLDSKARTEDISRRDAARRVLDDRAL